MADKITLMSEKFEIEQTGEEVKGITLIIDVALKQFLDIKNILNTKAKRIIAGAGVLIVIMISVVAVYTMTKDTTPKLKVKEESIMVEYGKTIKLESKEYVDTKGIRNKEKFLKKVKVESEIENEEGKEYPGIGTYEVTIKYEKQRAKVKVEVKDTTKPEFEEIEQIEILQDEEVKYEDYIKATDLQEITYTYDDKEVNRSEVGEYVVKVVAKDKSGNESSKEIKVIVKEKSKETEERSPEEGTTAKPNKPSEGSSNSNSSHSSGNTTNNNQGSNTVKPGDESNSGNNGNTNTTPPADSNTSAESKPTFQLPSNTDSMIYFMSREAARQYVYDNGITDYTISQRYDWQSDTYYFILYLI